MNTDEPKLDLCCPICKSKNLRLRYADKQYICLDAIHKDSHKGQSSQTIFSKMECEYPATLKLMSEHGKLIRQKWSDI
jgi:hypothetical protein